jgi:hypothetical protein
VIERIRQDVDRLIATPFDDSAGLQAILGTQLGPATEQDGWVVRRADHGTLAGVPIHDITLRTSSDGQGAKVMLLSLADDAVPFQGAQWPGATPNPPRPDAAGANAYWDVQQGGANVVLGLDGAQRHLIQISIRKR